MFHDECFDRISKRTLKEASLLIGSVERLCKLITASRSQYNNWLNGGNKAPFYFLILISIKTGISLRRLSPDTEDVNQYVISPGLSAEVSLKKIVMKDLPYIEDYRIDRLMIVGTNRWLISGLTQKRACKDKGSKYVAVMTVDLEALLFEIQTLKSMSGGFNFLMSERIAITFCLKQFLESLRSKREGFLGLGSSGSKWYECPIETEKKLAEMAGFEDMDVYFFIKQFYLEKDQNIMDAIDAKKIPFTRMQEIAKLSKIEQMQSLQALNFFQYKT
jgi:hypothetical protein